jgi:hypothetical protein
MTYKVKERQTSKGKIVKGLLRFVGSDTERNADRNSSLKK